MENQGKDVAINVSEFSAFKKMLPHDFTISPECSIFKIPGTLYRNNEKAYNPTGFCIGPWHCHHEHLQATKAIKVNYLEDLIKRSNDPTLLGKLQRSITEIEGEVRKCYGSPIYLLSEEFVNLIVLDGCFIIELLRKYDDRKGKVVTNKDPVFSTSCMLQYLYHDLILLENQVPWLVLELLFWLTEKVPKTHEHDEKKGSKSAVDNKKQETAAASSSSAMAIRRKSTVKKEAFSIVLEKWKTGIEQKDGIFFAKHKLIRLTLGFFGNIFSSADSNKPPPDPEHFHGEDIKHILDLLRLSIVLTYESSKRPKPLNLKWQPILTASRLHEAGVKFIKVSSDSILDVRFRHGVFEMPALLVQETTGPIFRNLVSYEQCLPDCRPVFTSYAKLLDNLIDTKEDIELLCKKEVIDNWMSPEDATEFFNGLYKDTFMKEFFYPKLCANLNRHCQQFWPRWRAAYVQNYFTKPWAIAAQIFTLAVFVLTFLQTFFTIKESV